MILVNGSEVPEISRGAKSLKPHKHNASRFRQPEYNTYNITFMHFHPKRLTIEEEKQYVTEEVIFVMLVYQKAGSGPHRASMT